MTRVSTVCLGPIGMSALQHIRLVTCKSAEHFDNPFRSGPQPCGPCAPENGKCILLRSWFTNVVAAAADNLMPSLEAD